MVVQWFEVSVSANHISHGPGKYFLFLRFFPILRPFFVSVSLVQIFGWLEGRKEVHVSLSPIQGAKPHNVELQHVDCSLERVDSIVLIVVVKCNWHQGAFGYKCASFVWHYQLIVSSRSFDKDRDWRKLTLFLNQFLSFTNLCYCSISCFLVF